MWLRKIVNFSNNNMILVAVLSCMTILLPVQSANNMSTPMVSNGKEMSGMCYSEEERAIIIRNITAHVQSTILQNLPHIEFALNCGPGQWFRVAHLNMSDPSQQCPSAWRQYNANGVRACGRPVTSDGSCPGASVSVAHHQYSRVCGRAIGYQIGSTDAFGHLALHQPLDSYYVYGVSITHGTPRNHIWTYAAGVSEGRYRHQRDNCPCSNPNHPDNAYPPSFVGDNYYCESGNPAETFEYNHIYTEDRLWDGHQCEGECCSNGKSPPWFSVELPNPTTDNIEVRICSGEGNKDETLVQLIELYVQ